MGKLFVFSLNFYLLYAFTVLQLKNCFIFAKLNTSQDLSRQMGIINAFNGCNIRVINFRGLNIDFQVLRSPILLLRYLCQCEPGHLYPFEMGSKYSELKSGNSSVCLNEKTVKSMIPPEELGISYVAQTFTQSFQPNRKNIFCDAEIYLHPPNEKDFPHMYQGNWNWKSVLKNPSIVNWYLTSETQQWKRSYTHTVPQFSLLVCNLTPDSICGTNNDVQKWIAGLFYDLMTPKLQISVII